MTTNREQLIKILRSLDPQNETAFIEPSENFDGHKGGVWLSAEESIQMNGLDAFNYYLGYDGSSLYDGGVLTSMRELLDKHGWFSEYYDCGTVFLWRS